MSGYDEHLKRGLEHLAKACDEYKLHAGLHGDCVDVELVYPRMDDGRPRFVEVNLECVRAADGIRITYDFQRDGWVIFQSQKFSWSGDEERDPGWIEVAFVQAWGSELPKCDLCEEYLKAEETERCTLCLESTNQPERHNP